MQSLLPTATILSYFSSVQRDSEKNNEKPIIVCYISPADILYCSGNPGISNNLSLPQVKCIITNFIDNLYS